MNTRTWIVTALLALAPPAFGQELMQGEELKACIRDHREVSARNLELTALKARLEQEGAAIESAERGLEQQQRELDADRKALIELKERAEARGGSLDEALRHRQEFEQAKAAFEPKLQRYNDGVRAQQARRDPHNQQVLRLNADLEALAKRADAVDARCANRTVRPNDRRAAEEALDAERTAPR
jgi:hypothetical protein